MESSTSWSLSAGVDIRRNCGRSGCRGRRLIRATKRHKNHIIFCEFCASSWPKKSPAQAAGVVDLSVAAVQINFSGFLIAATFGEGRPAADEPSAGECHRSEVSPIPQLPKAHRKDRAIGKCLDRDTRAGELLCRACFHTPNNRLAVCVELWLAIRAQQLKQKLRMIGSQNKTRELSCQCQRFRLIVHGERVMSQSQRAQDA